MNLKRILKSGFGQVVLVLLFLCVAVAAIILFQRPSNKVYRYDAMTNPTRFMFLPESYKLDLGKDTVFERFLMVSGWYEGDDGCWTGKSEYAEMLLPLSGTGKHNVSAQCCAVPAHQETPQKMTIQASDGKTLWEGEIPRGSRETVRFSLDNGDLPLRIHRLRIQYSVRSTPEVGVDSRILAINFKDFRVEKEGYKPRPDTPHLTALTSLENNALSCPSDSMLLVNLPAAQKVACDLSIKTRIDGKDGAAKASAWFVTAKDETIPVPLTSSLSAALQPSQEGNRWLGLQLSAPGNKQSKAELLSVCFARKTKRSTNPNTILLTLDTVRADDLPFYGNSILKTPNLDRLAKEGVVFQNAFSQADGTNPSFCSLMTSLYVHQHGIIDLTTPLPESNQTLAEAAKAAGYNTAAFISAVFLLPENSGLDQGFDTFEAVSNWRLFERIASDTTDSVLAWQAMAVEEPYFVWLHYYDAHTPYAPPEAIAKQYYPGNPTVAGEPPLAQVLPTDERRDWLGGITDGEYPYKMHLGEIAFIDEQVGLIWNALDKAREWKRTNIVLVSDHGECFGEKNIYFNHHGVYDPNLHIPMVWKTLDAKAAGTLCDDLVESIDVAPTLCSILKIPPLPNVSGISLARVVSPAMKDSPEYTPRETVFAEQVHFPPLAASMARTMRFKLVEPSAKVQDTVLNYQEALYDMKNDPKEETNALAQLSDEAARLKQTHSQWHTGQIVIPPPARNDPTGEKAAALKALGYTK